MYVSFSPATPTHHSFTNVNSTSAASPTSTPTVSRPVSPVAPPTRAASDGERPVAWERVSLDRSFRSKPALMFELCVLAGWGDFFATEIRQHSANETEFAMGEWASSRAGGIRNFKYSRNFVSSASCLGLCSRLTNFVRRLSTPRPTRRSTRCLPSPRRPHPPDTADFPSHSPDTGASTPSEKSGPRPSLKSPSSSSSTFPLFPPSPHALTPTLPHQRTRLRPLPLPSRRQRDRLGLVLRPQVHEEGPQGWQRPRRPARRRRSQASALPSDVPERPRRHHRGGQDPYGWRQRVHPVEGLLEAGAWTGLPGAFLTHSLSL